MTSGGLGLAKHRHGSVSWYTPERLRANTALHTTAYSLRSFVRASLRRSGFRRRVSFVVGWRINASLLGFAQRSNTDMRSVKSKEDKPVSDQCILFRSLVVSQCQPFGGF
jgi:hypothetical protein